MKKVFALALTASMALSLAACDWGAANNTDAPALNEETSLNEGMTLNTSETGNETATTNYSVGNGSAELEANTTDGNATSVETNTL